MIRYLPRAVDAELDELLAGLAAIALEGPKGVGKTATGQRRAGTVFSLDDPVQHALLAADVRRVDGPAGLVLVDEWQRLPTVWDVVRRSVDRDPRPGHFLLTGSAVPSGVPLHSGAGRIVQVRMRPMGLTERGLDSPTVSLRELLTGSRPPVEGDAGVDLGGYAEEVVRSGFPAIRDLSGRARRAQLDRYIARVVEREFPEQGMVVRRPATLRAWLTAYAAATSTTASYNAILDAATASDGNKPAKTTTITYRAVLASLWLLDTIPGWLPGRSTFTRLAQMPKHHLADPALAARLLGVDADALVSGQPAGPPVARDGTLLGHLFESLVTLTVRVLAQAAEATVHHLRTRNGDHEIDLIVERADRRVVALEVKLAATIDDRDVKHLHWLRSRLGDDLLDAVVVTTGPYAYRRPDGIAVVPASLLGP
ncbi:MAG: ATP-binding protein [Pseudonocardiaceae bacterium]